MRKGMLDSIPEYEATERQDNAPSRFVIGVAFLPRIASRWLVLNLILNLELVRPAGSFVYLANLRAFIDCRQVTTVLCITGAGIRIPLF
ncbi:hypothetical protein OIU77_020999 [Salix suchowensis]|uniref:Uncharacterized protein n=1 Tax=Salix suchowensis TaxID=1278906 RepID=A0ABQ9C8D9_9ROSI|nr:hypothetical protein OIU77_020999 [Salix suchowensis]